MNLAFTWFGLATLRFCFHKLLVHCGEGDEQKTVNRLRTFWSNHSAAYYIIAHKYYFTSLRGIRYFVT